MNNDISCKFCEFAGVKEKARRDYGEYVKSGKEDKDYDNGFQPFDYWDFVHDNECPGGRGDCPYEK